MSSVRIECGPCVQCGDTFSGYKGNPNRYCSRKCMGAERRSAPTPAMKTCPSCKELLPVVDFGAFSRADRTPEKTYYSTYCLACRREATDPRQTRRHSLKKRYGITPEQFDEMLRIQGGCAACGSETTNGKYWHIDHDHSCCPTSTRTCGNCIRAILCHGCNTALGNLDDDPAKVEKLLHYIRSHSG